MSDSKLQSLGSLGSKAKQIVANVAKNFLQDSKKETSPASYIRRTVEATGVSRTAVFKFRKEQMYHMGQYPLLSVLSDRLSPLNIDHSRNLPVEICGINYTEKYTNL